MANLRIIQKRKLKGLTQEQLAKLCETTQQTIAKIEQSSVDPKLSTLEKIAEALECELVELFYTKMDFAKDVNAAAARLKLDLSKVRSVDLSNLCWREAYISPYHPFWSVYKIKDNRIYFK